MMKIVNDKYKASYIDLTLDYIKRCIEVNRKENYTFDSVGVISILIEMLFNMTQKIDDRIPQILTIVINELVHQQSLKEEDQSQCY